MAGLRRRLSLASFRGEKEMKVYFDTLTSPLGKLTLVADDSALVAVLWENDRPERVPLPEPDRAGTHPVLREAKKQLREFFAGKRKIFDLPLRCRGTPFQNEVWSALREIPYGETISYATLATRIGRARAHRAVGTANGKNPLGIVIPCHRVVAANGNLGGFAGGLPAKELLLRLEAKTGTKK
jgi:methylated-DNA-[protein]-cysteine S-methyltransferase